MTDHCHAATALLTREYQGDYRRSLLTPATTSDPNTLTRVFHISRMLTCGLRLFRSAHLYVYRSATDIGGGKNARACQKAGEHALIC